MCACAAGWRGRLLLPPGPLSRRCRCPTTPSRTCSCLGTRQPREPLASVPSAASRTARTETDKVCTRCSSISFHPPPSSLRCHFRRWLGAAVARAPAPCLNPPAHQSTPSQSGLTSCPRVACHLCQHPHASPSQHATARTSLTHAPYLTPPPPQKPLPAPPQTPTSRPLCRLLAGQGVQIPPPPILRP